MKTLFTAAIVTALAALTGCNSGTPGGPGTSEAKSKEHFYDIGTSDNTFTLHVPSSLPLLSTSLKQGGTAKVTISIKRGKNFAQDVTLKFEGLPPGVTINSAGAEIKNGQSEANLTLTATDAAALGDFEITVVGHPTSGGDATNKFKITVEKEATFTVSAPSTSIKQGDTTGVTISVKREKGFDEDVSLKFADLPKGVTIDPASPVIKHGETETKLMLKAENDAALGAATIKVTGHPTKGPDALQDFKVTVDKK